MGLITNFLSIIIGGILGLTIGKKFNYLGVKTRRKFYSSSEEEEYIFDIEDIIDRFNEFKEFYNKLVKNNLALYIYIS